MSQGSATATEARSSRAANAVVRAWPPLVLALVSALAFAVFFWLPFYANHLNQYPVTEVVGGAHDPKDLWPADSAVGGFVFGAGGLLTLTFGPLIATAALMWACASLWRKRSDHDTRGRVLLLLAVVVALVPLAWFVSPNASIVIRWWLD